MRKIFIYLILSMIFSSCGSFINKWHKEMDEGEASKERVSRSIPKDKFAMYRNKLNDKKNSTQENFVSPKIKRKYIPEEFAKKRYTVDDLADNSHASSLWMGKGRDNYLFSTEGQKKVGDIILVNILKGLRKEISIELKRAFPSKPKPKKEGDPKAPKQPEPTEETASDSKEDKVYDRISTVVVEEINKGHLLLRGRKNLLFRKRRRTIEFQALVSRRDISVDDTIESNKVLETSITVLR